MSAPLDASTRRQGFFESESLDRLVSMVLELATEHWVLRERVYVLERAAADLGINLPEAMEAHRLTDAEREELAQMRARMLEQIMRTLFREHRPAPGSVQGAVNTVGREP